MFVSQPIMMMRIITTNTEIAILRLTILFSYIILTKLTNNLFLQLFILRLINPKMHNIRRQTFLTCLIYNVILPKLFRDIILII